MRNCLNGDSECPQGYKETTTAAFIRQSSSKTQVHNEVERATQVLTNNCFPNRDIKSVTKNIINKWYNEQTNNTTAQVEIQIFYKALFSSIHQEDERVIKQIVKRNGKPVKQEARIKLTVY